jgi:hypothetical protein
MMPELHAVAVLFDQDPVYDGYSGSLLFHAQTASFDDSSSDGATARRRVLSIGPDVALPARRVISLYNERWVVGNGTPDGFLGAVIRQHYTMKKVTDLFSLLTPAQMLAAAAGTQAYGQRIYLKDIVNSLTDSQYDTQWNLFVAPSEPAGKGTFVRDSNGKLFHVRNDYLPVEGLRILQSDTIDQGLVSVSFETGSYNPVTEVRAGGTTVANCLPMEIPKFYRFRALSDTPTQAGDMTLFVPTAVALAQGMEFTMAAEKWRVVNFQPEADAQVALVRRA